MKRPKSRLDQVIAIVTGAAMLLLSLWFVYERASRQLPQQRTTAKQPPAQAAGEWQRWENCRLAPNRNNDGDSFLIEHEGRQAVVRLYFVDCPEKEIRRDNIQRLQDQARYFGMPAARDELQPIAALGQQAQSIALTWLAANPFTVVTKFERVYDSERIYAHIFLGKTLLAESLVTQGLARIHTKGEDVPELGKSHEVKQFLKKQEAAAKRQGKGGWKR
jgi:endonuclease YncB( thermonuclease family)